MTDLTSVSNQPPPTGDVCAVAVTPTIQLPALDDPAPDQPGPPAPAPLDRRVRVVAAAAIFVLFAVVFYQMFDIGRDTRVADVSWSRLMLLYNSVQTIVVAAASVLLGVQVSARQTEVAVAQGAAAHKQAEKLTANIKAFQTDLLQRSASTEKAGQAGDTDAWLVARAMTLLR